MIDFIFILWITTMVIGPIAIWASYNHINATKYINKKIDEVDGFCPYKYKWQIADDLAIRDDEAKFSYLMTMPKDRVKDLWLIETN